MSGRGGVSAASCSGLPAPARFTLRGESGVAHSPLPTLSAALPANTSHEYLP